jgi:hypothetical protein
VVEKTKKIIIGIVFLAVMTAAYFYLNRKVAAASSGNSCSRFYKYSWGVKDFELKECRNGEVTKVFYTPKGKVKKLEFYTK